MSELEAMELYTVKLPVKDATLWAFLLAAPRVVLDRPVFSDFP